MASTFWRAPATSCWVIEEKSCSSSCTSWTSWGSGSHAWVSSLASLHFQVYVLSPYDCLLHSQHSTLSCLGCWHPSYLHRLLTSMIGSWQELWITLSSQAEFLPEVQLLPHCSNDSPTSCIIQLSYCVKLQLMLIGSFFWLENSVTQEYHMVIDVSDAPRISWFRYWVFQKASVFKACHNKNVQRWGLMTVWWSFWPY